MNNQDSSHKWLTLSVILIGTFMAVLSSSLVNIAIPKMMSVFGVPLADITWVLTAYTLAMGSIVPLTGFLSDTIGTKKLYVIALAVFTLGSALCGMAWSNNAMIVFRIIQAVGGGLMMPVGMTIIFMVFPLEERGKALGIWGIGAMCAPALGPTLGGYIISSLDWRLLFYINVPIGIIGVIFALFLLKETPKKPYAGDFDIVGFITSVLGIACTLYVVGKWSSIDWKEIQYPILLALGLGNLILFVVNELTHSNPLLEIRLLKIYNYSMSQAVTAVTTLALMGGTYMLPIYLQSIRGYTAMQSGMMLFPSAIAAALMMPLSGALFDRLGVKIATIPGLIILGVTTYELSFLNMDTSNFTIIMISFIRGIGLGLAMMPVRTAGMNDVPANMIGKASALTTTVSNIFSSMSVTLVATLISTGMNSNYAKLAEQVTPFNQTAVDVTKQLQGLYMASGLTQADAQASALSTITGVIQQQAYLDAINYATAFTAIAVLIAVLLVFMMRTPKRHKAPKNKEVMYDKEPQLSTVLD
jgi:EmrB/QacA subfamily drug resistance transporter